MATFGHIAAGLAVGRAGTRALDVPALMVIAVAAVLPDVDLLIDINHRGPTHSVGFAAIVGVAVYAGLRLLGHRMPGQVAILCAIATLSHVVLDILTAPSPVAVLWPLTSREFALAEPLLPAAPTDESLLTRRGIALVAGELAWSVGILVAAGLANRRAKRA